MKISDTIKIFLFWFAYLLLKNKHKICQQCIFVLFSRVNACNVIKIITFCGNVSINWKNFWKHLGLWLISKYTLALNLFQKMKSLWEEKSSKNKAQYHLLSNNQKSVGFIKVKKNEWKRKMDNCWSRTWKTFECTSQNVKTVGCNDYVRCE